MKTIDSWLLRMTITLALLLLTAGQTATINSERHDPLRSDLPLGVVVDDGVPF